MAAPMTPPTIEWVVETGAPIHVDRLTHMAADISDAIIAQIKVVASATELGSMIFREIVDTTSPPASNAPALSASAAIVIAPAMVRAFAPTAGPMLLDTSLAPILIAI